MKNILRISRSNTLTAWRAVALASLLFTATHAMAQGRVDSAILGSWTATSGSVKGVKAELGKDYLVIDGQRMAIRFVSPGVMDVDADGERERVYYSLSGDVLTIRDDEESTTWRRTGNPTPQPRRRESDRSRNNPLDNPLDNPLGNRKPADPFARKFAGSGMKLALTGTAASGYRGTLTFRNNAYPAQAWANGNELAGSFRTQGGREYRFRAVLAGDQLTLQSGNGTYRMAGEKIATNPLDGPGPIANPEEPGTKALVSQKSGVAARIPEGWSLLSEAAIGCILNPGFRKGERLNVSVSLHCLPLDPKQADYTAEKLMAAELPGTRQELLKNAGLKTFAPEQGVQRFTCGGKQAAFVTMRAETRIGQRAFIWFALRIESGKILVCNGIFIDGNESTFLPKVKKVFETLVPATATTTTPERRGSSDNGWDAGASKVRYG